jgi:hypothetical protein
MKRTIWLCIAGFHLLVAALHAAHIEEWGVCSITKPILAYGDYTGSGNIFSFFAPRIGNEIAVIYTIADSTGHQQVIQLEGDNRECNRRLQTIYNFFSIEEAQPLLARSCADYVLRQHSGSMIRITVVGRRMPTMGDYRKGVAPQWTPFIVKDYRKKI